MLIFARRLERPASRPLSSLSRTASRMLTEKKRQSDNTSGRLHFEISIFQKAHVWPSISHTFGYLPLFHSTCGSFKEEKQRKAHGLSYKVTWESTAKRTNNSSLYVHVLEKPLSAKFQFFTDKEVTMKTMLL